MQQAETYYELAVRKLDYVKLLRNITRAEYVRKSEEKRIRNAVGRSGPTFVADLRSYRMNPYVWESDAERWRRLMEEEAAAGRAVVIGPPDPDPEPSCRVAFPHGLGDTCQFLAMCKVFQNRGHDVAVELPDDKRWMAAACGVAECTPNENPTVHGWKYTEHFRDLHAADWQGNKTGGNLCANPFPALTPHGDAWRELIASRPDVRPSLSQAARDAAAAFLEGMPRPIICLHSVGNSWQADKSIDGDVVMTLYKLMLERFAGSIISIDGEQRVPIWLDDRVKRTPYFGTEVLAALLAASDLLVGIDSGPLHMARLTHTPTLGVFMPTLPPQHVSLPAAELTCLSYKDHLRCCRKEDWNIVLYHGKHPTAVEIADATTAKLESLRAAEIQSAELVEPPKEADSSALDKTPPEARNWRVFFRHGLGDNSQAIALLTLAKNRGHNIRVRPYPDKEWLWRAAGFELLADGEEHNVDHPWIYPWQFSRLEEPDCEANKTAFNIQTNDVPEMGARCELWPVLCATRPDVRRAIGQQAKDDVAELMGDAPRPWITMHTRGNAWIERKSWAPEELAEFYELMFPQFTGTLLLLDPAAESPSYAGEHAARFRRPPPGWDIEHVAAAIDASDLLLGVDSGPGHLARLLNARQLFVTYPSLPARHVALPYDNVRYLVPQWHIDSWTPDANWDCVGYEGDRPTPERIVKEAIAMLERKPLAVGIPVLSRYDLLENCLKALFESTRPPARVFIIDNGLRRPAFDNLRIEVHTPQTNLGVAASWNFLYRLADAYDLVVLNDDVVVGPNTLESMLATEADVVFATPGCNGFSAFLLKGSTYADVGPFDETFWPAYWEDADYSRRLDLAGKQMKIAEGDGIQHVGSATKAAGDEHFKAWINERWAVGRDYYHNKWGGGQGCEKYTTPFNGAKA